MLMMAGWREAHGVRCVYHRFRIFAGILAEKLNMRRTVIVLFRMTTSFNVKGVLNSRFFDATITGARLPSPAVPLVNLELQVPSKDWPHAPVHRMTDNGIYFVTAGTLHKKHFFDMPQKRDLMERLLLSQARAFGWQLEAWAVFANHYHFVARGNPDSANLGEFIQHLHGASAHDLNLLDGIRGRQVWFNFWDVKLTIHYSYLARLNYVHQNAVRHKLVAVASQYPWCSAAWFERTASPAQVKTIYSFKVDRVKVADEF